MTDNKPFPRMSLSQADIKRLIEEPSPDVRADVGGKVASGLTAGAYTGGNKKIADDIVALLIEDAQAQVRAAISENIKEYADLPREQAMKMARDVEQVSLPILEFSSVLTDDDLIEIVSSSSENKQMAVARRKEVSVQVSDALIETNSEKVVETLVHNDGAKIQESGFTKIINKFRGKSRIEEGVAHRNDLPMAVAEKLVVATSAKLQEYLISKFEFPTDVAMAVVEQAREKATIGLLTPGADRADVKRLVDQLHRNDRLTASLILRAACTGDMAFFEVSLARLADVPIANARVLIHDAGPLGLKSLYDKAKLPANLYRAFRVAVDVYHSTELTGHDDDREGFMRTMIERILTQVDDINADDLDYLMAKLAQVSHMDMAEINPLA